MLQTVRVSILMGTLFEPQALDVSLGVPLIGCGFQECVSKAQMRDASTTNYRKHPEQEPKCRVNYSVRKQLKKRIGHIKLYKIIVNSTSWDRLESWFNRQVCKPSLVRGGRARLHQHLIACRDSSY